MRLLWLSWQLRSSPPRRILFLALALPLACQGSLTITTTQGSIPVGTVGTSYSFTFAASGGSGTYAWSVLAGSLPAGLSLTTATGLLSGTPTGCASYYNNPTTTTLAQPCNFPALFQNTFDPMVSSYVIQVNDGATSVHQGFTTSMYWSPDLTTYLTSQNSNFALMAQSSDPSVLAGVPAPPLVAGGHLVIANPFFRSSDYDNQSAWNAWVDAMHDAGMGIVNIEVDLECLVAYHASCLALYKGAIDHAHALGMKVSINPAYYTTGNGNADPSCGDAGCPTSGSGVGTVGGIGGACASPAVLNHAINNTTIGTSYGSGVTDWHSCVAGTSISGL
ncbi:MAG TPA: Ig domain-containing protein, partial [Bryobacteraceae bacterium]|nr:Ig domain-containing protein [Bryobacteraceae bacterium]